MLDATRRSVHFVVFDGFAEWEPGLALAALRRSGGHPLRCVGLWPGSACSMGGLRVVPDASLEEVELRAVRLLVLPGGDAWVAGDYPRAELETLLRALVEAGVPVAAIGAATAALARAGLLDGRRHTSHDRAWLAAAAPGYRGADLYVDAPAVRDGGVLTASGAGGVEFARELLAELDVLPSSSREAFYALHKTGRLPDGAGPASFTGG